MEEFYKGKRKKRILDRALKNNSLNLVPDVGGD